MPVVRNKKGHQPDFLSPLVAFGNLPKRPQAGPDTVTKIITLLTRIGDSAMRRGRDRVGFAFNIAYVQSTGSVREMQGWIGINKFYRGIRWVEKAAKSCSDILPPEVPSLTLGVVIWTPTFGSD